MTAHACYVMAAWGVSGIVLFLLGLQSWLKWKKAEKGDA